LLANGDAKSYAYALAFKAFEETRTPVIIICFFKFLIH